MIRYFRFVFFVAAFVSLTPFRVCISQTKTYNDALRLEDEGKFAEATSMLSGLIGETSVSPADSEKILYEIERMRRIRIDYSLTADELYSQLERTVRDITRPEFDGWIRDGKFDARIIDDTLRFVGTSRSNLFFRNPEIADRRLPLPDQRAFHTALLRDCISIEKAADSLGTPYVLPKDFNVTMNLTADSGAAVPGEIIRAWLPIPREFPFQVNYRLASCSSRPLNISSPGSTIRSLYMEQPADSTGGSDFKISYKYRTLGVHFNLDRNKILPYDTTDSVFKKFTSKSPNIIFTDKIKRLSTEIIGNETNPLMKARKIYDWVSGNIKYSFAREYSTISNISDYCLTKEYGDCGQEAMLFITLCRYNGIPARWQSGWFTFPNAKDIHDWTEIYLPPYGWVPVDPYMGIAATRYMNDLTEKERETIRDFYFGGLDQYRMSANSDNNQSLSPVKKFFRSDNVDFQRGELESKTGNIYFNKSDYDLSVEEVTLR